MFDAFNRRDFDASVAFLADNATWRDGPDVPGGGVYEGAAEIAKGLDDGSPPGRRFRCGATNSSTPGVRWWWLHTWWAQGARAASRSNYSQHSS
jgi:SnoaL-like domain